MLFACFVPATWHAGSVPSPTAKTPRKRPFRVPLLMMVAVLLSSGYAFVLLPSIVKAAPLEATRTEVTDPAAAARTVMITATAPDYSHTSACSGFLVGPRTVLTAAHCLVPGGQYRVDVASRGVGPLDARTGISAAYTYDHSCTVALAVAHPSYHGVSEEGTVMALDFAHDLAVLVLADCPALPYYSLAQYSGGPITNIDHPGDEPLGTLWTSTSDPHALPLSYRLATALPLFGSTSWRLEAGLAVSSGSSGGVVLDERGDAVGVTMGASEIGSSLAHDLDGPSRAFVASVLAAQDPSSTNA